MSETVLIQPDAKFVEELAEYGAGDVKKCYQCATCSVTCELSGPNADFPRKQMVAAQWGLKDRLLGDPGPWLCFYCGECSKRCPRGANPGETMMALRRWLTAQYDWTGISGLMYRSVAWELGILGIVAAIIIALFTLPHNFGFGLLAVSGPDALRHVMLDKFAPKEIVHPADNIFAALLATLLLINAGRMFHRLTRGREIPLGTYFKHFMVLVRQGAMQERWRGCTEEAATRNWLRHLLLVTGYATMFTMVVVFLPWFQVQDSSFHWTSILGYYATAVLLGATVWMIADRMGQRTEMHRFSHLSDWLFPILLFLTAITGIVQHVFRLMDWAMATYVLYMVHLSIAIPMLVVEVPFGKWSHLLYRPLAIYVAAVRNEVEKNSLGTRS